MKLAVPDLISNSYFPAAAAVELGFFKQEGLDVSLELIFPVDKSYEALRDGAIDFVGGSAHSALAAFPDSRGDLNVVKGRSIGAAPWVEMGLRRLLIDAGIDLKGDNVRIAPVPGAVGA